MAAAKELEIVTSQSVPGTPGAHEEHLPTEEEADAQAAAIAVPEDTGEGGKLKMIVTLVKRCFGVKDIASMRLSLPASLLEPIPNLEYWHYLDRPDLFAAINDSPDAFERMLAVLRFTLSKDLRHIRGKPIKPYNSVLGEHFRSHWDVPPPSYSSNPAHPPILHVHTTTPAASAPASPVIPPHSATGTSTPTAGRTSRFGGMLSMRNWSTPTVEARGSPVESIPSAQVSKLSLVSARSTSSTAPPASALEPVRIAFLTEQVSHHPPVSAFMAECPAKAITLSGVDQIAAKVTSTMNVRIGPGPLNKGVFINIGEAAEHGAGEQYHITHPSAVVNGLLRGNLWVSMCESTVVKCSGGAGATQLRAVLEYKEEGWLGKAQYAVEGVVFTYSEDEDATVSEWTKVKHVPRERVIAELEGSWRGVLRWRRVNSPAASNSSTSSGVSSSPNGDWHTLIDLGALDAVPMTVRPLEAQLPNESRRLWQPLTQRLLAKEYSDATKAKIAIEQKQRDDAAARKAKGITFVPAYFDADYSSGRPQLTAEGRKALDEELKNQDKDAAQAQA
ncbi:unnamed protein product [Peniophora sp. CBMAI 1063]|nr:unnamed protein product [Peniophora sp. CBMAI 1063]